VRDRRGAIKRSVQARVVARKIVATCTGGTALPLSLIKADIALVDILETRTGKHWRRQIFLKGKRHSCVRTLNKIGKTKESFLISITDVLVKDRPHSEAARIVNVVKYRDCITTCKKSDCKKRPHLSHSSPT